MIEVDPGTVVVYGDIGCPWAHLAVFRLHRARAELGLEDRIVFEARAFPLEIFNEQPTPKKIIDAELAVAGALDPDAGWQMWQRPESEYPGTMLPALEAVQAAKEQSLRASEQLDRALRVAFFRDGRPISLRHEILDVAQRCPDLDAYKLADALDSGRARALVMEQKEIAEGDEVDGSPHVFFPDGTHVHNPGVELEWQGAHGKGFPVVTSDDRTIYESLLRNAVGRRPQEASMDESSVREHAQAHGQAMIDGDLRRAGSDLTPEVQATAGDVMKHFPKNVESAELVSVAMEGDEAVVQARYAGEGKEVMVESRWGERDGRPKITTMKVV